MTRSTKVQKSERLNAAHRLIAQKIGVAEAAMILARDYGLSRRQAYRYLEEAQAMTRPVPVVQPSVAVTFKLPVNVIRDLRAYAATSDLALGEIVGRAVALFLASEREHG
jgi:predicted DNA-binding transcriptional regulator YafY